jgi:hypothetical protein
VDGGQRLAPGASAVVVQADGVATAAGKAASAAAAASAAKPR